MDIFVVARSSPLLTLIDDTRMCVGEGVTHKASIVEMQVRMQKVQQFNLPMTVWREMIQ